MSENPYAAGFPVSVPGSFYGRSALLMEIEHKISMGRRIVLCGQRRIGKTSLLHRLEERLKGQDYLPIYFSVESFFIDSMSSVLAEMADRIQLAVTERYGAKLEEVNPEFFSDSGRFFLRRFLPSVYRAIGSMVKPVLLIDEFDALSNHSESDLPTTAAGRAFAPFLKRLLDSDRRLHCVLCVGIREDMISRDILRILEESPKTPIWVLGESDARELILHAEREGTLSFQPDAVNQIISLTRGHPYLTQVLCDVIWDRAYSNDTMSKEIGLQEVEAASRIALEKYEYGFSSIWDGLEPAEKLFIRALSEVMKDMNERSSSAERAMRILGKEDIALDIMAKLDSTPSRLVIKKFLAQEGDLYSFQYPLFQCWVERQALVDVVLEVGRHDAETEGSILKGEELIRSGQWHDAISLFSEVLEVRPRNCAAMTYRGQAFMKIGSLPRAVNDLRRAYSLKPWVAEKTFVASLVAYSTEVALTDEERALQIVEDALRVSPNDKIAGDLRAKLLNRRGDRAARQEDLVGALAAYRLSGDTSRINRVRFIIEQRQMESEEEVRAYLAEMTRRAVGVRSGSGKIAKSTERVSRLRGIDRQLSEIWWAVGSIFRQEEYLVHVMLEVFVLLREKSFGLALSKMKESNVSYGDIIKGLGEFRSAGARQGRRLSHSERIYGIAVEGLVGSAWELTKELRGVAEVSGHAVKLVAERHAGQYEPRRRSEKLLAWSTMGGLITKKERDFRRYWEGMRALRSLEVDEARRHFGLGEATIG